MKNKELGALGEELARQHLEQAGYSIVTVNYRSPDGEVDLVARHGGCLVFVEVKARKSAGFGPPEEAITALKKQKLVLVAQHYIQNMEPSAQQWRIDVVAIELDRQNRPRRIEIFENAVGLDEPQ